MASSQMNDPDQTETGVPRIYGNKRASAYRDDVMSPKAILITMAVALSLAGLVVWALWSGFSSSGASDEGAEDTPAETAPAGTAVSIDLSMVGDVIVHRSVYTSGDLEGARNYDHLFAQIGSELASSDIAIINQETLLAGDAFDIQEDPKFNGPTEIGDAEAAAGFNVILRATEHTLDHGVQGLRAELKFWERSHPEVAVLGIREPTDSTVAPPYVYEKDGFKIAILNYAQDEGDVDDESRGAIAPLEQERVASDVAAAKQAADLVVVCPHWGSAEYSLPDYEQREWADTFLELGVDAVIGSHPHVLQPVEVLTSESGHRMVCFWSVGCFISGLETGANMVGGMAKLSFAKSEDGSAFVTGYGLYPTVTHIAEGADETAYMLYDYTDDLANTSRYPHVTPAWAADLCAETLGEGFDRETGRLWVDL